MREKEKQLQSKKATIDVLRADYALCLMEMLKEE